MKVSELTNTQLDYWVAKAQGWTNNDSPIWFDKDDNFMGDEHYRPTISWIQCGELIEKYETLLYKEEGFEDNQWKSSVPYSGYTFFASTPQRAVCMAVIASVYGDEVDEI